MSLDKIIEKLPIDKVYDDVAHPAAEETGKIAGRIPRLINAALVPLDIWIEKREFKLEETKALLAQKLATVNPEEIVSPDPYVAVPALQAIAYSMDNKDIRELYANLLASSMTESLKAFVHPSFVEIIKQLSPDEAKILKFFTKTYTIPLIRLEKKVGEGTITISNNISEFVVKPEIESPSNLSAALENLDRLKLIELTYEHFLIDNSKYDLVIKISESIVRMHDGSVLEKTKGLAQITDYGKAFTRICI